tara:strand:+ start:105 stop:263 length:159 start_codon:yes stop_codon:yes gene_type:complete
MLEYLRKRRIMSNSKQLQKLKNLNVKAEKCLTRDEAKKILTKANKAQSKINF